ncbi:flagellar biosynthetic protein FliR [bacterium]|nr:flagellar biosynthetic protein FliR [candidate division CSSED10-310 bacterium]
MGDSVSILYTFFLVFARIVPISVMSPVLGAHWVNGKAQMVMCGVISACMLPAVTGPLPGNLVVGLIVECLRGCILGLLTSLPFHAIEAAGEWLDVNRGETLASLLIPQFSTRTSSMGRLFLVMATALFFSSNHHLVFIRALQESFVLIPMTCSWRDGFSHDSMVAATWVIDGVSVYFRTAMRITLPIVFLLWLTDIVLGFINRVAPALQVFYLGLPLKLWLGIGMAALITRRLVPVILDVLVRPVVM